jgi:isoleucyl-tRNA synthetase
MYQPIDPKTSFPSLEEQILSLWEKHGAFRRSVENRAEAPEFVIYDGPAPGEEKMEGIRHSPASSPKVLARLRKVHFNIL